MLAIGALIAVVDGVKPDIAGPPVTGFRPSDGTTRGVSAMNVASRLGAMGRALPVCSETIVKRFTGPVHAAARCDRTARFVVEMPGGARPGPSTR